MLGIVIANWNGERIIDRCLQSLSKQKYKKFKIYIIDNGSTDRSIEIIENYMNEMEMEIYKLDYNSGFAKANNIGISNAIKDGCEYILTLNNDIEMDEYCLINAFNEIEKLKDNFQVYQLFMINYYEREICDAIGIKFDKRLYAEQLGYKKKVIDMKKFNGEVDGACAGAAIYSSRALNSVVLQNGDYFDSNFFAYYEDVDLALRLKNRNFKTKLLKEAIVYHMHSATSSRSTGFKEYYLIRNLIIYTKRNQSVKEYNRCRYSYYKTGMGMIIKNVMNPRVSYNALKGMLSGIKEANRLK